MKSSTFSLSTAIDEVRNRATAKLKHAESIAEGLQNLDATVQIFTEDRGSSEMQGVVDACRHLSALMETAVTL